MALATQTDSKGAGGALKEAAVAALITLALCTPIIMFRTESDPNDGTLLLLFRPLAVLVFMALAFVGRLAVLTIKARPARAKAAPAVARPAAFARFSVM